MTRYKLMVGPLCAAAMTFVMTGRAGRAMDLEGYTEPYRTVHVASDESGIVQEVFVKDGDRVTKGQPLARLNSDVQEAMLAIARQNRDATGRLDAAQAELRQKRDRLSILEPLCREGCARQEEVDQARTEVLIAEANVREAREEQEVRRLDYERIRIQLERRTILAPSDGVVMTVAKRVGEYVAPNNPEIVTLVQLRPLLANFNVLRDEVENLVPGSKVNIRFVVTGRRVSGIIDTISPVTDAESGTVPIKVRIDNGDGEFRSGDRCRVEFAR